MVLVEILAQINCPLPKSQPCNQFILVRLLFQAVTNSSACHGLLLNYNLDLTKCIYDRENYFIFKSGWSARLTFVFRYLIIYSYSCSCLSFQLCFFSSCQSRFQSPQALRPAVCRQESLWGNRNFFFDWLPRNGLHCFTAEILR